MQWISSFYNGQHGTQLNSSIFLKTIASNLDARKDLSFTKKYLPKL